ncbi:MAG TPA: 4-(cytidine 5'-diphospho)-2-C-methyl-D-erythritol kinase [Rhizomicrobium sp.]
MAVPEFARAKINLTLHVGRRRDDFYHELDSLVVFADIGDELAFSDADDLALDIDGPFGDALKAEPDNLVLKAARALAREAGIEPRARIALTKNLPLASGLGGGSADAAAALRGLVKLWKADIGEAALHRIALSLGADVPVCLYGKPVRMEGIGERLTEVHGVAPLDIVLVNPGVRVATADVFARLDTRTGTDNPMPAFHGRDSLIGYLDRSCNDLEKPAASLAPAIREVVDALCTDEASLIVRMSGSGATCYGLYANAGDAAVAATVIAREHHDWWVKVARTM